MQKVFVSSTVFDLLDVRAEVEQLLREMGLVPVLSGSGTSAFQPLPDRNSIETCLANLRQSDALIVILCQRYGPSLAPAGFPNVSATHLEYKEGCDLGKPIYMYVRDRLEADYCVVKKNKNEVQPVWVRDERDRKLFDLLGQHRTLAKGKPGSNWFDTFRDSIDLKRLIKRDFGPLAARHELEVLVVENRVPIIAVAVDLEIPTTARLSFCNVPINIRLTNVGTVPAYKLFWQIEGFEVEGHEIPVLAPTQKTQQSLVFCYDGQPWSRTMTVAYYMPQGHCVRDEYTLGLRLLVGNIIASGATCLSKVYQIASGDARPFVIAEAK